MPRRSPFLALCAVLFALCAPPARAAYRATIVKQPNSASPYGYLITITRSESDAAADRYTDVRTALSGWAVCTGPSCPTQIYNSGRDILSPPDPNSDQDTHATIALGFGFQCHNVTLPTSLQAMTHQFELPDNDGRTFTIPVSGPTVHSARDGCPNGDGDRHDDIDDPCPGDPSDDCSGNDKDGDCDNDGTGNAQDPDDDNDNIPDEEDHQTICLPDDCDNDGILNVDDPDDDNDGTPDLSDPETECGPDSGGGGCCCDNICQCIYDGVLDALKDYFGKDGLAAGLKEGFGEAMKELFTPSPEAVSEVQDDLEGEEGVGGWGPIGWFRNTATAMRDTPATTPPGICMPSIVHGQAVGGGGGCFDLTQMATWPGVPVVRSLLGWGVWATVFGWLVRTFMPRPSF